MHIDHRGTLIARHPRLSGHHQRCIDPVHYQGLRPQPAPQPARGDGPTGLGLTSWTGPFPEVAVRALGVYEALCEPEVGHD